MLFFLGKFNVVILSNNDHIMLEYFKGVYDVHQGAIMKR